MPASAAALSGSNSGRRLGNAVLAYLAVTTLLVTWAPFAFQTRLMHGVTSLWSASDLVLNVVMFLPLGFFWKAARARNHVSAWWQAGLLGALFSLGIELGQLFLAERFTSGLDVVTNGFGAALGARAFDAVRPRVHLGAQAVSALALELPLTGLVGLLVPLLWSAGFASGDTNRLWLLLPVAAFGGAILGAVHGAYLQPTGRVGRPALLLAVSGWFVAAAAPGAATQPDVLLAGSTLANGAAWLGSAALSRARRRRGEQRLEIPTLRMVLPLFAVYLALSALWPLDAVDGVWRGAWMLAPARAELTTRLLMQAIEYCAGFTIVGYVTAELHGREYSRFRAVARRVFASCVSLVLLLEIARGWNTTVGASAALGVLALAAGVFGGWLYHLQRAHVRTLLSRPVSTLGLLRE